VSFEEIGSFKGTIKYSAPEILRNREYDTSSDVYSFGLVLYEIITSKEVYPDETEDGAEESVNSFIQNVVWNEKRPDIPKDVPQSIATLIKECWDGDRKKRPSFKQIIKKLEEIVLELAIPDEYSRRWWKEKFGLQERVSLDTFLEDIASAPGIDIEEGVNELEIGRAHV